MSRRRRRRRPFAISRAAMCSAPYSRASCPATWTCSSSPILASVSDIRAQIMEQRNRGAAVLLVSEDLDEILELSDRIAVMSGGKVTYLTDAATADRTTIGRHMAGH